MLSVIIWWFWMLIIGLAALPLAHRLSAASPTTNQLRPPPC